MHAVRARQREEFGGFNWGAAFFGWLVAVGLGALLVGLLAAAGAAVGLTELSDADVAGAATEIGLGGAIALLAALAIAYFAGGYVAGRMSRFDGARQGLGAWLLGLVVTVALAVAAPSSAPSTTCSSGSSCRPCRSATPSLRPAALLALAVVVRRHAGGRGARRESRRALPPQGRSRRVRRLTSGAQTGVWNPTT